MTSFERRCARCEREMRDRNRCREAGDTRVGYGARGLCATCYQWLRERGDHIDHDRVNRPIEDLLEDYELLRQLGFLRRS